MKFDAGVVGREEAGSSGFLGVYWTLFYGIYDTEIWKWQCLE